MREELLTGRREFLKTGVYACLAIPSVVGPKDNEIPIVVGKQASQLEKLAASELSQHLQRLYRSNSFPIQETVPDHGSRILLGTLESLPQLRNRVSKDLLARPGSYVVSNQNHGGLQEGIVAGSDAQATLFAVYALLEKIGYGYYLSYNAAPRPSDRSIRFDDWRLSDHPLAPERIVFTWHNFLSSCSTWDLADWERWIIQLSRMRFNSMMVHAYGNNPMFTFTHNGESKPVGYLTTSALGRDWGTEHVNDVRRIVGGDRMFSAPVFGAKVAQVPNDSRVEATCSMMQQVFDLAEKHGLKTIFALDVDTETSNPQNVVETLPANATFEVNGFRLANPDAPAGFEYYKSQVKSLMGKYPNVSRIAVWMRAGRTTPWRSLKAGDFPPAWRTEYDGALAKRDPGLQTDPEAPSMFAISKIVKAYRKALDDLGKGHVALALGSWNYSWLQSADAFVPPDVMFLPLDSWVGIGTDEAQAPIKAVSKIRAVVPIVWAHHDDRAYVGRPYTPFASFTSLLAQSGNAGFGIIHWTTRPLDLYFKSLAEQVWDQTRDQPLEVTCKQMAARTFGETASELGKQYLIRWITEAPMFGRETTDRFLDHPLVEPQRVITECRGRLALLNSISADSLTPAAGEQLNYYRDIENFIAAFYESHSAWERSVDFLTRGDVQSARQALAVCDPRSVLEWYGRAASRGGATHGEMGVLIAMNLKWLPYIVSQRQAVGLDAIRYHFEPTEHEALAQGAGQYTFYFDSEGKLWKCLGQQETQYPTFRLPFAPSADQEVLREACQTGLQSSRRIALRLRTIADQDLLPGTYNVQFSFVCPSSEPQGNSIFDLVLSESEGAIDITKRIDVVRHAGGKDRVLSISLSVSIHAGFLSFRLEPVTGSIFLCGVIIEPAEEWQNH